MSVAKRPPLTLLLALLLAVLLGTARSASAAPVNLLPPVIMSDTLVVGAEVTAWPGQWTPPVSYSFTWFRCTKAVGGTCTAIDHPSSVHYNLTAADVGHHMKVRVDADDGTVATAAWSATTGPVLWAEGVISNDTLALGVRPNARLARSSDVPSSTGIMNFGLRLLDGQYDVVSYGEIAEGWGYTDASGILSWAGFNRFTPGQFELNAHLLNFSADAYSATSRIRIDDADGFAHAQISHVFTRSAHTNHLFEVAVTIVPFRAEGIKGARYRRVVDWDVEPTPFQEVVHTLLGNTTAISATTDDGRSSPDMSRPLDVVRASGEAQSDGPGDLGAAFDLDLGDIPYPAGREFKLYFGVAPSRAAMLDALKAVGAEAFSLAQGAGHAAWATGAPAVAALGFSGVGGAPLLADDPPTAELTETPALATTKTDAKFGFAAGGGATFECKLDDGDFESCSSPASYHGLSEGAHRFFVRSKQNGHTQKLHTSYEWYVGDDPLGLHFSNTPAWWSHDPNSMFQFGTSRAPVFAVEMHCALDGEVPRPCYGSDIFMELEPGPHHFIVYANHLGVEQELRYDWTISSVPAVRLRQEIPPRSNIRNLKILIDASTKIDIVECKFNDEPWTACDAKNEHTTHAERPGEQTFSLRGVDETDTRTPEITRSWVLDEVAPKVEHNVPATVTSLPFAATISVDEPVKEVRCRIDAGTSFDCSGGASLAWLAPGAHELEIRAVDEAGNVGAVSAQFDYAPGAPVAAITAGPSGNHVGSSARFEFSGTPGATFECALDGTAFAPCLSPIGYDMLMPGRHRFEVRAVKDGVTQPRASSRTWNNSEEPLGLYWRTTPSRATSSTAANFEFDSRNYAARDLAATCQLDDGPAAPCLDAVRLSGLTTGPHTFTVRASRDGVEETITHEWRILTSGDGVVAITAHPDAITSSASANFLLYSASNPAKEIQCRLDAGPWERCVAAHSQSYFDLAEGEHTFEVRMLKSDDSTGPVASYTWTIDQTPPVLDLSEVSTVFPKPYTLPLSADEPLGGAECELDAHRAACPLPLRFEYLSPGPHTLTIWGRDRAGNVSDPATVHFDVPGEAPAPPLPQPLPPVQETLAPPAKKPARLTLKVTRPKQRARQLTLRVTCPATRCTVSGWVKVGRKKHKLKSVRVRKGTRTVRMKFNKQLARSTMKAGKKKTRWSLTVKAGKRKVTRSGRF